MDATWEHGEAIRRAVWRATRKGRDYRHGSAYSCRLSFEQAEALLAKPDRGRHASCLDHYVDGLAKLEQPRVRQRLADARSAEGYAARTAANMWKDEVISDRCSRGGLGKTRQLRGVRLRISRALADPWLDELASRLLELASSSRSLANGWPYPELALERATFHAQEPDPADEAAVRVEVADVEATMVAIDPDWHWKYLRAPRLAWQADHPISIEADSSVKCRVVESAEDVELRALRVGFAAHLRDPLVPSFLDAVRRSACELGTDVTDAEVLRPAGVQMLADLLESVPQGASDVVLLAAVSVQLGPAAAVKLDREVLAALRAALAA